MPIYEEYCATCKTTREYLSLVVTDKCRRCPKCKKRAERSWSLTAFHDFDRLMHSNAMHPYTTTNIRKDGKPVEIRSHKQLEKECKINGVVPAFGKENKIG